MFRKSNLNIAKWDKVYITSFLFLLVLYIYIYFSISQANILLAKDDDTITIEDSSFVILRTFFAFSIILITIFLRFKHRFKLTPCGKVLYIFSIYMLLITLFNEHNNNIRNYITQYTSMSLWIYIYLFFFTFFKRIKIGYDTYDKFIFIFTIYFSVLFLFNYFVISNKGITFSLIESYFCIMMLPFIITMKSKKKILLIGILLIISLLSAKRTGSIALIIALIFYLMNSSKSISEKFKSLIIIILSTLILYFISVTFFEEQLNHIIERYISIKEDGGSGRDQVYEQVFNLIQDSNTTNFLWGHGYNTVINTIGFSAHNDFLEVAYDYGIIGFSIYILLYITISYRIFKNKRYSIERTATGVSLILFLMVSSTSHLILYPTSIICLCAFWGFIESGCYKKMKENA